MEKRYHKGQELTMSELGLSLEELAGQPLELFAREGAKLLLTVALEEEVADASPAAGPMNVAGVRSSAIATVIGSVR
jgi:hypothetical protein